MLWTMDADGPSGAVRLGAVPATSAIVGNGDYDGDGNADLLSRDDATGALTMQLLVNGAVVGGGQLPVPAFAATGRWPARATSTATVATTCCCATRASVGSRSGS